MYKSSRDIAKSIGDYASNLYDTTKNMYNRTRDAASIELYNSRHYGNQGYNNTVIPGAGYPQRKPFKAPV